MTPLKTPHFFTIQKMRAFIGDRAIGTVLEVETLLRSGVFFMIGFLSSEIEYKTAVGNLACELRHHLHMHDCDVLVAYLQVSDARRAVLCLDSGCP